MNRIKSRWNILLIFLCIASMLAGFALLAPRTANAAGADLENVGAAIRTEDPVGLRFTASLSAEKYGEIVESGAYKEGYSVGMVIAPKSYFDEAKAAEAGDYANWFYYEKEGKLIDLSFAVDQLKAKEGKYEFSGAVVDIKDGNRNLEYCACAYIEHNGVRAYGEVSAPAKPLEVATAAIENTATEKTTATKIAQEFGILFSDITVSANGGSYNIRKAGTVTLQQIADEIAKTHELRILSFQGKENLEETVAGTAEGNPVALTAEKLGSVVTVEIEGQDSKTVTAEKDTGLKGAFPVPEKAWMYDLQYNGATHASYEDIEFDTFTKDVTVSYKYKTDKKDASFSADGVWLPPTNAQVWLASANPSEGFGGTFTYVASKADVDGNKIITLGISLSDGSTRHQMFLMKQKDGTARFRYCMNQDWTYRKEADAAGQMWTPKEDGTWEFTLNYLFEDGTITLAWNGGSISQKVTEAFVSDSPEVSFTPLDTSKTLKIGFETWNSDAGATLTEFVLEGLQDAKCHYFGRHVEGEDSCTNCDVKKYEVSGTVQKPDGKDDLDLTKVTLSVTAQDGTVQTLENEVEEGGTFGFKLWEGTYTVTASCDGDPFGYISAPHVCNLAESGESGVTLALGINYFTDEKQGATVNGTSVTLEGASWIEIDGADSAIYLKATIVFGKDLQGIALYTDSRMGHDTEILFANKGFACFKDNAWDGEAYRSDHLGITAPTAGAHTVEYFIHGGNLYFMIDGMNFFGKPLDLSSIDEAFTEDATYHIALCNFDGNGDMRMRATVESVLFGEEATQKYTDETAKQPFSEEKQGATVTGTEVVLNGAAYAYLTGSGSAVYLRTTMQINGDHQGITIYTDSVSGANAQICFQHNGYTLFKNHHWEAIPDVSEFSHNELLGIPTATTGVHIVEYFIHEGKLYITYDGMNLFAKPLTLSELNTAFTAEAEYHIGLYNTEGNGSSSNFTFEATVNEVLFGEEATQKYTAVATAKSPFSEETKSATVNGTQATLTGNAYAFVEGSGSAVYMKMTLCINNDHQGIAIYTDSVNGANAQICFQANGYSCFKDYAWTGTILGQEGDPAIFNRNQLLGIETAKAGMHTVEFFIIEGKLYVIYDGQNLFEKPLVLSDLNAAFTADATYHIAAYNFDGNKTLEVTVHEALFGEDATAKYNAARA